jgi:hypothetical protein
MKCEVTSHVFRGECSWTTDICRKHIESSKLTDGHVIGQDLSTNISAMGRYILSIFYDELNDIPTDYSNDLLNISLFFRGPGLNYI